MAAMVLLLAASCKKQDNKEELQMMTFSAGVTQNGGAKTGLIPEGDANQGGTNHYFKQIWLGSDEINVNNSPEPFQFSRYLDETQQVAEFSGLGKPSSDYYAIYPYSSNATLNLDGENTTATFLIPDNQTVVRTQTSKGETVMYVPSFAPMVAHCGANAEQLGFTNLCGLLELRLYCPSDLNLTVSKIAVTTNEGKIIAGTWTYNFKNETFAKSSDDGQNTTIYMSFDQQIEVSKDPSAPTSFLFVIPPVTTDANNFNVYVYGNGTGNNAFVTITKIATSSLQIQGGQVLYNKDALLVKPVVTPACTSVETNESAPNLAPVNGLYACGEVPHVNTPQGIEFVETGFCCVQNDEGQTLNIPPFDLANPDHGHNPSYYAVGNTDANFAGQIEGLVVNKRYAIIAYVLYRYKGNTELHYDVTGNPQFRVVKNASVPAGFVDLGTHVDGDPQGKPLYWAKCNLGATKPEEYGGYYPWGDITARTYSTWDTYIYGDGDPFVTKYCRLDDAAVWKGSEEGPDNILELDDSDDAAYVASGGANRMPTKEEYDELKQKAYFEWTTSYNGKAGCIIYKSVDPTQDHGFTKTSGHVYSTAANGDEHIFIPAGGRLENSSYPGQGTLVKIWTKTLLREIADDDAGRPSSRGIAIGLKGVDPWFIPGNKKDPDDYYQGRYFGMNLRPVCEGN